MQQKDKAKIVERYEGRLEKLGPVPQALGWLKGRQVFRFHFLAEIVGFAPEDSVLDLGCAFGNLEPYLRSLNWKGVYCGVDIVPGLIAEGRKMFPHLDLRVQDIQQEPLSETYDWVFSSGALTSKTEEVDSYDHLKSMLALMFANCRKGVAVNFCSPHVDSQSDINFHPDMGRICDIFSGLTKRYTMRHDYMPYEFTAYLYKDDAIFRQANVFQAYEPLYQVLKTD